MWSISSSACNYYIYLRLIICLQETKKSLWCCGGCTFIPKRSWEWRSKTVWWPRRACNWPEDSGTTCASSGRVRRASGRRLSMQKSIRSDKCLRSAMTWVIITWLSINLKLGFKYFMHYKTQLKIRIRYTHMYMIWNAYNICTINAIK